MPTLAVLNLDDPGIRVKTDFAREALLDLGVRLRFVAKTAHECAIRGVGFIERGLRRGAVEVRGPVEPVELDEDRARLLSAAMSHRREGAFDVAATNIGRHPDRGFEAHRLC